MKIGMFVTLEWEAANDDGRHLANTLDLVRAARHAGFSSLWLPQHFVCLLYTSPSPRDRQKSRMPSSA